MSAPSVADLEAGGRAAAGPATMAGVGRGGGSGGAAGASSAAAACANLDGTAAARAGGGTHSRKPMPCIKASCLSDHGMQAPAAQ
jgi:hypothetical protein